MLVKLLIVLLATAIVSGDLPAPALPAAPTPPAQSDLDAFMARVLARRDDNWKKMQQYILEEDEQLHIIGPDGSRLYGFDREYTWFIRDAYFIRSPLKVNGVAIPEAEHARGGLG